MKYTKKYTKRRKPKTHKKRPKQKSRKNIKKKGGSEQVRIEAKIGAVDTFKKNFLNEEQYKPFTLDNMKKNNIFHQFDKMYNTLTEKTISCDDTSIYIDKSNCNKKKCDFWESLHKDLLVFHERIFKTRDELPILLHQSDEMNHDKVHRENILKGDAIYLAGELMEMLNKVNELIELTDEKIKKRERICNVKTKN